MTMATTSTPERDRAGSVKKGFPFRFPPILLMGARQLHAILETNVSLKESDVAWRDLEVIISELHAYTTLHARKILLHLSEGT